LIAAIAAIAPSVPGTAKQIKLTAADGKEARHEMTFDFPLPNWLQVRTNGKFADSDGETYGYVKWQAEFGFGEDVAATTKEDCQYLKSSYADETKKVLREAYEPDACAITLHLTDRFTWLQLYRMDSGRCRQLVTHCYLAVSITSTNYDRGREVFVQTVDTLVKIQSDPNLTKVESFYAKGAR
jgi:hypothetical protein